MTWNQAAERLDATVALEDAPPNEAVALLVDARKRAHDAQHTARHLHDELATLKAAHAWIKTSERMPADDDRVLALVVDDTGTEQVAIVNFIACVPAWQFDSDDSPIDDEIVMAWMTIPGRAR